LIFAADARPVRWELQRPGKLSDFEHTASLFEMQGLYVIDRDIPDLHHKLCNRRSDLP
jgi:hypothetical protein